MSSITAMEHDNRLLLERAIAAEEAAALLKEKNKSLQHRIDYFASHPSHRPKTAPEKKRALSSSAPFHQPNEHKSAVAPSLLQLPQTPTPPPRQRSPRLSSSPFLGSPPLLGSEARLSPNLTPQSASPFREPPRDPFFITYTRPRASTTSSTTPFTPSTTSAKRRPIPLALSEPLSDPYDIAPRSNPISGLQRPRTSAPPLHTSRSISSIGAPIPGSVNKHTVTYQGVPIADRPPVVTISLAEAQRRRAGSWQGGGWEKRKADAFVTWENGVDMVNGGGKARGESWREKALPPNGPISPSAVPGKVEIGCADRWEGGGEEEKRRRRTGVSGLFRWGRCREC